MTQSMIQRAQAPQTTPLCRVFLLEKALSHPIPLSGGKQLGKRRSPGMAQPLTLSIAFGIPLSIARGER